MTQETVRRILIAFFLSGLVISAFVTRLENFKRSDLRSIDEMVYYRMAKQVAKNPADYNTIPYGRELAASGRPLPGYFFQPLFKHPPLFTFAAALSTKLFGARLISAEYVSLFFGVLMIPLIYFLAKILFNNITGYVAAFLIWMDPAYTITSQKVWMETMLAFFMVLSIYLYIYASVRKKDGYFIGSAVSSGLAMLTKYTGCLSYIIILVYTWFFKRELFLNKKFIISLLIPFLMMMPWIVWNVVVYGGNLGAVFWHSYEEISKSPVWKLAAVAGAGLLMAIFLFKRLTPLKVVANFRSRIITPKRALLFLLLIGIFPQLVHSFQFDYVPFTSWSHGNFFYDNNPFFYFGRLVEFSPLYILGLIALFDYREGHWDDKAICRVSIVIMFLFFVLWQNYQTRYILPITPFLLLLAAHATVEWYRKTGEFKNPLAGKLFRVLLSLMLIFAFYKTMLINILVSFPQDFCYY